MNAGAQANTAHEETALVSPHDRRRFTNIKGSPFLPVAALALVSMTASAVWLAVGGWWWLPACIVLTAAYMVTVCRSIYAGWMQRRKMHRRFDLTRKPSKDARA